MRKILVWVGSYSEANWIAPLVHQLRALPSMQTVVCVAAQQDGMIQQALGHFGIAADEDLSSMADGALCGIDQLIEKHKPDCVLVQGGSFAICDSVHLQAPAGNIESGLQLYELHPAGFEETRQGKKFSVAKYYFVSSELLRNSLLKEGISSEKIYLTDNMEVDALHLVADRIRHDEALQADLARAFPSLDLNKRLVLITGLQPDNSGEILERLCLAVKNLAQRPDVQVVCPLPQDYRANGILCGVCDDCACITFVQPRDYLHFVYLMMNAHIVLTDKGISLLEALSLGKPVLAMHDAIETSEVGVSGSFKLVARDSGLILQECNMFLDDSSYYRKFSMHRNPYGDGRASQRIAETMLR
jgi:UDP-N-acetylglucosamine 2-epimerase (non-hydrolysing)